MQTYTYMNKLSKQKFTAFKFKIKSHECYSSKFQLNENDFKITNYLQKYTSNYNCNIVNEVITKINSN